MTQPIPDLHDSPTTPASPLPEDVERASAYAWRRGAVETIVFHGAAQLTSAGVPLQLEAGTWLLARWDGASLPGIPDGELLWVMPESPDAGLDPTPGAIPEPFPRLSPAQARSAEKPHDG